MGRPCADHDHGLAGVGEAAGATPSSASGSLLGAAEGAALFDIVRFAATSALGAPIAVPGRSRLTIPKIVAASAISSKTVARPTTPTFTRCIVWIESRTTVFIMCGIYVTTDSPFVQLVQAAVAASGGDQAFFCQPHFIVER
jgi:hypothetical protein